MVANAGGVNPAACARAVLKAAPGLKVAVVHGDDVFDRVDEFLGKGYEMRDMDTGHAISTIRTQILSANAYIGAFPLAEALDTGADVVIAGRSTDTALTLGPMVHKFKWKPDDWDKLCCRHDRGTHYRMRGAVFGRQLPVWIGRRFPTWPMSAIRLWRRKRMALVRGDQACGQRGRVHSDTVKEQLLYELGDPKRYITPGLCSRLYDGATG